MYYPWDSVLVDIPNYNLDWAQYNVNRVHLKFEMTFDALQD